MLSCLGSASTSCLVPRWPLFRPVGYYSEKWSTRNETKHVSSGKVQDMPARTITLIVVNGCSWVKDLEKVAGIQGSGVGFPLGPKSKQIVTIDVALRGGEQPCGVQYIPVETTNGLSYIDGMPSLEGDRNPYLHTYTSHHMTLPNILASLKL